MLFKKERKKYITENNLEISDILDIISTTMATLNHKYNYGNTKS